MRWIDRVLQNLLDNALRYVPKGGLVRFAVVETAGKLRIEVTNSGDSIPKAELSRLFERYFTAANRKKDSTGLGLTIVKKIIDLHGEDIQVESKDRITTFRFTLPAYRP